MSHIACVDVHGAGDTAQAVGGTSHIAQVIILLLQPPETTRILACLFQAGYFALHHNALARRERKAATHTVDLTETALNALVDVFVGKRKRFEVLDEAFGVVIEDDSRVEDAVGVEYPLYLLHYLVSLVAPFMAHKGSHVAARSMFCLERTIVLIHHQSLYLEHQVAVLLHLLLCVKGLCDDEVIVALKRMPIDAGVVIAMLEKHLFQVKSGLGEVLDMEGNILDDDCGAHGTGAAH